MPVRGIAGSDYLKVRTDFKIIKNPYGDDDILLVPAISPDISLIHAFRADRFGNCVLNSALDDALLARASDKVIISAEEIVETSELKSSQRGNFVSRVHVSAVVRLPGGAAPTSCGTYYREDEAALLKYLEAAKDPERLAAYLREFSLSHCQGGI